MRRLLLYPLGFAVAAVLAVAALLSWLAATAGGTAFLLRAAAGRVPGELEISEPAGTLLTGISAAELRYRFERFSVHAVRVEIRPRLDELLRSGLVIDSLSAGRLELAMAPSGQPASRLRLDPVALPLVLELKSASIDQLDLRVAGTFERLDDLRLQGRWSGADIDIAAASFRIRDTALDLHGRLRLDGRLPVEAGLSWSRPAQQLAGEAELSGDLERLAIRHRLDTPMALDATGTIHALDFAPRLEARTSWSTLALPPGEDGMLLRDGNVSVDGWFDNYTVRGSSRIMLPGEVPATLAIRGNGDLDALQADSLTVQILNGEIAGRGRLVFAGPELNLTVTGRNLDPSAWAPELDGRLNLEAGVEVGAAGDTSVRIASLEGSLRERPFSAEGRLELSGNRLEASEVKVRSGMNRLRFDGTVHPVIEGRFTVDAPELSGLWPGLAGRLSGAGELAGTLESPVFAIEMEGAGLRYADLAAEALSLRGRVDTAGLLDGALSVRGVSREQLELGTFELTAGGRLDAHRITATGTGGPVAFELQAEGAWREATLVETLVSGAATPADAATWALREPAVFSWDGQSFRAGAQCWEAVPASVCSAPFEWSAGGVLAAAAELRSLPLGFVARWLDPEFEIEGTADADFRITTNGAGPEITVRWEQSETVFRYREPGGTPLETHLDEVFARAEVDRERAIVAGRLRGEGGIEVDMSGTLLTPLAADGPLDLRVHARIADLAGAEPILNRFLALDDLRGQFAADLGIGGSRATPVINGTASLRDGQAVVRDTGASLTEINAVAAGRNGAPVTIAAGARSGDGVLYVRGELDWSAERGAYADFDITGEAFQAFRLPGRSIAVSPDLRARIDERRLDMKGRLAVPRAEIIIDSLPDSAERPSPDTVVHETVADTPTARGTAPELTGDLRLTLGDDVRLSGFGLDTRLAGELELARAPGTPAPVATGTLLFADGRFGAYGKTLTIDRGTLIFAGPLDDPDLDVRATRAVDYEGETIVVGVMLSGPASNIQTRLFSEPAMSEADALSFMVIDRPLSRAESDETGLLTGAALSLGLKQTLPITERLEESLGLDEVSFEGSGGDDASFVAGKRLGDDLYLRYMYGLFNRIGTVLVRYEIGRGLSLEAGSGEEQTLDLVYSVDRD